MNLIKMGAYATALSAILALGWTVDSRYQTADAATVAAESRELGDLNTQIEIIQLELRYIANKVTKTPDDYARENMLRAKLAVLLERQLELRR